MKAEDFFFFIFVCPFIASMIY